MPVCRSVLGGQPCTPTGGSSQAYNHTATHSNFTVTAKLHCPTQISLSWPNCTATLPFHGPSQINLVQTQFNTATLKFHGPSQINSIQTRIQHSHAQFHCGSQIGCDSHIWLGQSNYHSSSSPHQSISWCQPNCLWQCICLWQPNSQFNNFMVPAKLPVASAFGYQISLSQPNHHQNNIIPTPKSPFHCPNNISIQ